MGDYLTRQNSIQLKKGAEAYEDWRVSEYAVKKALKYFITKLNWKLWRRKSQKQKTKSKCQIIAIPICEGLKGDKRTHLHILLGNIPEGKLPELETLIKQIWGGDKFRYGAYEA